MLVQGLKRSENDRSLSALYQEHAHDLRDLLVSRFGCGAVADDLVQEAFVRLLLKPDFAGIKNVKSYLFRIGINLAVDYFRSKRRTERMIDPNVLAETVESNVDNPTAEESLLQKEAVSNLHKAIKELSPLCQKIFWLSRSHGFRNYEIANQLGVCVSTVEKNISKATRHCRTI